LVYFDRANCSPESFFKVNDDLKFYILGRKAIDGRSHVAIARKKIGIEVFLVIASLTAANTPISRRGTTERLIVLCPPLWV
jgi:hypothetical protein